MVIIDPQELFVEVPVERGNVTPGSKMSVQVEEQSLEATVDAILEPRPEFEPLRELFTSVATARLLLKAAHGTPASGQAVISEMIPRHPVAEVPIVAIRTDTDDDDSERMVQVIRNGFIRTLPVQVLGQQSQEHAFVSGRFLDGDEVIVKSSEELVDGSWIRPLLADGSSSPAAPSGPSPARAPGAATQGKGSVIGPDGIRRPVYNPNSD